MDIFKFKIDSENFIKEFEKLISETLRGESVLNESMMYSALGGGKRLRPLLMYGMAKTLGVKKEDIMPYALALELIHTYSLIHDDLPSMDDDDVRRGKATNHIVYGEAVAILSGDGLLNKSYEVLFKHILENTNKENVLCAREISKSAGIEGMILGQIYDMENENKEIDMNKLKETHKLKTGKLIKVALTVPMIISKCTVEQSEIINNIGEDLGLMYQIKDDLLDVYGDSEKTGKNIGSDIKKKKATYVSILGKEATESKYNELMYKIEENLNKIEADIFFKILVEKIMKREK